MINNLIVFIFGFSFFFAQDLTGKWVMVESDKNDVSGSNSPSDFYEELNLVAGNDNQYFGHSYDSENGGYCRFWLKANFANGNFVGSDDELIDKSESHNPSEYDLMYERIDDEEFLVGRITVFEYNDFYNGFGFFDFEGEKKKLTYGSFLVKYKKVSNQYIVYNGNPNDAVIAQENLDDIPDEPGYFDGKNEAELEKEVQKETAKNKYLLLKDGKWIEIDEEVEKELAKKENEIQRPNIEMLDKEKKQFKITKVKTKKRIEQLNKIKEERDNKIVRVLPVKARSFSIDVWDDNKIDGDKITIFANDSILIQEYTITANKKIINVPMDVKIKEYRLVFIANNLGEIPPNSAKIRIRYGQDRQHYFNLFTDEQTNAVIVIKNKNYKEPLDF